MTYKEMQNKISSYNFEIKQQYINEHSEFKVGEVIKRCVYENNKILFKEILVLSNVTLDKEGNLVNYFYHNITPTGRVGSGCICMPTSNKKDYWANGKHYKEVIRHFLPDLETYKKKYIKNKKSA